ncbi:uncharacterized mitochondrial protein AtMg00810-like [Rosa chinensis]|uniref:uncharacterized mitochondrial protein AtMg00810-like n=1 Tax=Rosa chinensis TaxID=74649 RepID=UPI000D091AF9|nr:uncharacterized mitochondrial protein AtMg00810-like [Rosa chinensis]
MAQWNCTRLALLPRDSISSKASITVKPSALASSQLLYARFCVLLSLGVDLFVSLMSRTLSSMDISKKMCTCHTHLSLVDPSHPSYVCKLHKALYGLKQAPRVWFHCMSSFLSTVGFRISKADSSLFIYQHGSDIIYFLLYVDDIVVTGSNDRILRCFINALGREFDIRDLGPLHYFLGLQVTSHSNGIHLNQVKYAHDILVKHDLLLSKPVSTPMLTKSLLSTNDGVLLDNPTTFCEMVGSLQYLTITRLDIAFAVNSVSQYMSKPHVPHLIAAKWILRYIKGTLDHGLSFCPQLQPVHLSAYSDANWAGCPDSRCSTSGYLIYLGSNLISWCSKKQPTIARSSAESEYHSLAHASAETT